MTDESRIRTVNTIEWALNKVILKAILVVALIVVLAFVILPSIAFGMGLLFYMKEAITIVIDIFGDAIQFFTT